MDKYKIGETVELNCVDKPNIFCIHEITEITCSAGTQTTYSGRLQGVDKHTGLIYTNTGYSKGIKEFEISGLFSYKGFWKEHQKYAILARERKDRK